MSEERGIEVVRVRVFDIIVCAPDGATDDEITAAANAQHACGTERGWCHVVRDDGEHPQSNPVKCAETDGRTHFVVRC